MVFETIVLILTYTLLIFLIPSAGIYCRRLWSNRKDLGIKVLSAAFLTILEGVLYVLRPFIGILLDSWLYTLCFSVIFICIPIIFSFLLIDHVKIGLAISAVIAVYLYIFLSPFSPFFGVQELVAILIGTTSIVSLIAMGIVTSKKPTLILSILLILSALIYIQLTLETLSLPPVDHELLYFLSVPISGLFISIYLSAFKRGYHALGIALFANVLILGLASLTYAIVSSQFSFTFYFVAEILVGGALISSTVYFLGDFFETRSVLSAFFSASFMLIYGILFLDIFLTMAYDIANYGLPVLDNIQVIFASITAFVVTATALSFLGDRRVLELFGLSGASIITYIGLIYFLKIEAEFFVYIIIIGIMGMGALFYIISGIKTYRLGLRSAGIRFITYSTAFILMGVGLVSSTLFSPELSVIFLISSTIFYLVSSPPVVRRFTKRRSMPI
ncbi:MAG: hypothetical protein ACTSSJ_06565 [Candidatus Odinarchaeia archaeon]